MTQMIAQYALSKEDEDLYNSFMKQVSSPSIQSQEDVSNILQSIPTITKSPEVPLLCLSHLLGIQNIHWPIFELIRCHSRLWHRLPEEMKDIHSPLDPAISRVKSSYRGLLEFFSDNTAPALIDPQTFQRITHGEISRFIHQFSLPIRKQSERKSKVVIALPNGTLLAVATMAVSTWYTAVPVSISSGPDQFKNDVQQSGAKVILVLPGDVSRLAINSEWIIQAGIEVLVVEQLEDLTFKVNRLHGDDGSAVQQPQQNGPDDVALILFTSGTSGTKKMVPVTIHRLVSGVAFVGESWGLTAQDSCLNQMPLNHM